MNTADTVNDPREVDPGFTEQEFAYWDDGKARGRVLASFLGESHLELSGERVLDLGCAAGGISLAFAERAATVIGIDVDPSEAGRAARRVSDRGQSEGISFGVGSALDLPFESASFGAVVLIGVLEYMGRARPGAPPETVQAEGLTEIARVLRPGGRLLLATENRWYPPHLIRSPHQRTWLACSFPPTVVRTVRRWMGWEPFWDRLHGHRSLVDLMKSAGFADVHTYIPVYGYQFPKAIVSTDDSAELIRVAKRGVSGLETDYGDLELGGRWGPSWFSLAGRLGLQRALVPAFMCVAERE